MPPTNPRTDLQWVERRFDRVAWSYPLFERLFLVPKRARAMAVSNMQARLGQRILSIGCGRGPMLPALAREVGEPGQVIGVDLSARMLRIAERSFREHRNIRLIRMNALEFSADPFDAVLFGFSLSSFADPDAVLRHAWDLLVPGGRLVVLDGQLPPTFRRITAPLMPTVRWFLEQTVLGDPDMQPLPALQRLGVPVQMETMRTGAYFVATLEKPY